jgi:carotenoid cleavage dioxygenase-like enzyme
MKEIPKRKLENSDLHASDKYMETPLEDTRRNELENYKQSLDIRRVNIEFAHKANMTFQKSVTGQHDDDDPTCDVPDFYLLEDYQKLFQSVDDEHVQEDVKIEVILPAGLSGVYYITGPGILMQDDGGTNVYPFDWHGLIRRFQINGKRGNSKLLDKVSVSDDKATKAGGKTSFILKKRWTSSMPFLKRGVGTNVEIFRNFLEGRTGQFLLVQRNHSNTCVIPVGRNKLLSTFERGLPFLIDTDTLETIGDLDFRGALHDRQVLVHSRYDTERNVLVIIGVSQRYYNYSLEIMQDM